jgi:hypothetical protein
VLRIEVSTLIAASEDSLWNLISKIENEPNYWYGTKSVRELKREGNTIWREKIQMFRNSLEEERVNLFPQERKIVHEEIKGFMRGTKIDFLMGEGLNSTRLTTIWDISPSGLLKLANPLIKRHIRRGTVSAHARIKEAAESAAGKKMNFNDGLC